MRCDFDQLISLISKSSHNKESGTVQLPCSESRGYVELYDDIMMNLEGAAHHLQRTEAHR